MYINGKENIISISSLNLNFYKRMLFCRICEIRESEIYENMRKLKLNFNLLFCFLEEYNVYKSKQFVTKLTKKSD